VTPKTRSRRTARLRLHIFTDARSVHLDGPATLVRLTTVLFAQRRPADSTDVGWLLDEHGVPHTRASLARLTHLEERQVATAIEQLLELKLLVAAADGLGVPDISTFTEGRSTERQRERRAAARAA
jgi:hypothetical protein